MKQNIHIFFSKRLSILAWAALLLTIIGQAFGTKYWVAELLTHFVPHAGVTLLLASLVFPREGLKISRILFLSSATILLVWSLMPFSYFSSNQSKVKDTITIHYQNVNIANISPEKTMQQLHPNNILILLEANSHWKHYLDKTQINKKHCGVWSNNPYSMHTYLSNKAMHCELFSLANYPAIKITLIDERVIFVVHPPPPINKDLAQSRKQYLYELKQMILATPNVMVIGDFNVTAFSPLYRDFMEQTDLERPIINSHPTWLPFALSIDQILFSNKSPTPTVKSLAWRGSDHRGFKIQW